MTNKLESLTPNLLGLSHDDLLERIRGIREDRQISKRAITKKVAAKEKKEVSFLQKAAAMDPDQLADLIKMLEEAEQNG